MRISVVAAALFGAAAPCTLVAQRAATAPAGATILDSARWRRTDPTLRGLRWRLVGPFRGGRAVAVVGHPTDPRTFWFGSVNGGVWKTSNGGNTWTNVTDGKSTISSVGAIAVAPSDPNVVWVGGGEGDLREDWTYGDGVWRSTDGGSTWSHLGLDDARQIARIVVDPRDPDRAYVAALGHASGPNATRGVYRTTDGGKTWQRVLFADDSTGSPDVEIDPSNPRILFASLWRMQRAPWGFESGAGHSGVWKSADGGDHWTEITRNEGLPKGRVGKIGIAISPANPRRVWAIVETPPEDSTTGIYRSDDGGDTWHAVNRDQKWSVRPWYYSYLTADPSNENGVYAMNLSTWKSIDGGKTFTRMHVPHGDTHVLWVDPHDARRMISGNDGGATISYDGGDTWSSIDNQPTAQFYHVATDDAFPYRIYGAQQDNSTVAIASRSDDGAIGDSDWWPVGGGESGYIAPKPGDPNTVIAGTYTGTMTRYDVRTRQRKDISVWLNNYDGWAAKDVPNRFQWTYPILYSKADPHVLYAAANRVFRSTNDGDSWEAISPDLTRHDPKTLGHVGGPVTHDETGTEWYATVFALAESPLSGDVLWAGSDDGLIHLSRDRGKTWTDVTPREMNAFTRVSIIEPSHHDAGTAYVAANRYQLDDFHPYLWKTTDYGKSWTRIDAGIPSGAYTRTIREDPVRRGLLFVGTETGVWYSTTDGGTWAPLQLNLPRVSVRDLGIHGSDLIAATHGRAFWVMDDISALRALPASTAGMGVTLFRPDTVVRFAGGARRARLAGENPPAGAIIDLWFPSAPAGKVTLDVLDGVGKVIRSFASAAPKSDSAAARDSTARVRAPSSDSLGDKQRGTRGLADDTLAFEPADSLVPTRPGINRFVWDLRYPPTRQPTDVVNDEGSTDGPMVAPGAYTVRLTAGGKTTTQPLVVRADPRRDATQAGYDAQLALALQVQAKTNELVDAATRIESFERQLDGRVSDVKSQPYGARVDSSAKPLRTALEAIRDSLIEIHSHADEITLHYPIRYYNMLLSLADMVQSGEGSITEQERAIYADIATKVDANLARLRAVEGSDLAAFNKLLRDLEVPGVIPPKVEVVP